MTCDHSDWVCGYFTGCTRDLTPVDARPVAVVIFAPMLADYTVAERSASVLSKRERDRSERLAAKGEQVQFKLRRAFQRYCGATASNSSQPLSKIHFEKTESGRPYLPGQPNIWFSFSSCRFGFLGAWSSAHAIGVDIEDQTRIVEPLELARCFYSECETAALEKKDCEARLDMFFRLWTLKEAALKSIGAGLPFGLDAFRFAGDPSLRIVHAPDEFGGSEQFDAHRIGGTGGCAALVVHRLS